MRCWFRWILLASASLVAASPVSSTNTRHVEEQDGTTFTVFHHGPTGSRLRYVNDSGICETTPGVHQRSGYASVGKDMNMFFWHFDARKDPETAPLVMIFNGGPGAASSGLPFDMNGPCTFTDASPMSLDDIDSLINFEPEVNPKSFNEFASLLYVDQPLSTGFSYGQNFINSTEVAAESLWKFLQAFLAEFEGYRHRELAILTASYGGRTTPALANTILEKNVAIQNGHQTGVPVNISAIGLINAWMDAEIQAKENIHYALNNDYHRILNASLHGHFDHAYEKDFLPRLRACENLGTVDACCDASATYLEEIDRPIRGTAILMHYDPMYLAKRANNLGRTGKTESYLKRPEVRKALGARKIWEEMSGASEIRWTGDGKEWIPLYTVAAL